MSKTQNNIQKLTENQSVDALKENASMIAAIGTLLSKMGDNQSVTKQELSAIITMITVTSNSITNLVDGLQKDLINKAGIFEMMASKETQMFRKLQMSEHGETLRSFIRLVDFNINQDEPDRVRLEELFRRFSHVDETDKLEYIHDVVIADDNFKEAIA